MRIELDVFGDRQLSREILRVGDRAEDASPALRGLADYFRELERDQFATAGSTGSGGWPDLADSTKRRKRASKDSTVRRNAERILVATEAMMDSLTEAGDEHHVEHVSRDELEFGTTVEWTKWHQPDPQGRRAVELAERHRREAVRKLQRYFMTGEVAR